MLLRVELEVAPVIVEVEDFQERENMVVADAAFHPPAQEIRKGSILEGNWDV